MIFFGVHFTVFAIIVLTSYVDADYDDDGLIDSRECIRKLREAGFVYVTGRANYMLRMLGMTEAEYMYIRLPGDSVTKRDPKFRDQLKVWEDRGGGLLSLRITNTILNTFNDDDFKNLARDYAADLKVLSEISPGVVRNTENWCEIRTCYAEVKLPKLDDFYEEKTLEKEKIIQWINMTDDEKKDNLPLALVSDIRKKKRDMTDDEKKDNLPLALVSDMVRIKEVRKCKRGTGTYDEDHCERKDIRIPPREEHNEKIKSLYKKYDADGKNTELRIHLQTQSLVKTKRITKKVRRIKNLVSASRVVINEDNQTFYKKFYFYILSKVGMTKPAHAMCNLKNCLSQLEENGFTYNNPLENLYVIFHKMSEKNMPLLLGELATQYWYHLMPPLNVKLSWKRLSKRGFCLTTICSEELQRTGMVQSTVAELFQGHKVLLESDITDLGDLIVDYSQHLHQKDALPPLPYCGYVVCMAELVAFGIDPNLTGEENYITVVPFIDINSKKAHNWLDFFPSYILHLQNKFERLEDSFGIPAPRQRLPPVKFCRIIAGKFWY